MPRSRQCPYCQSSSGCHCPPSPSLTETDTLADELEYLALDLTVTAADVLGPNEIGEDDPMPKRPHRSVAKEYYLVTGGRSTGCFSNWFLTSAQINNHPANVHSKFGDWDQARGVEPCTTVCCMKHPVVVPGFIQ
ncbi:hypothetical protein EIP86_009868 [Pleurotus ostreatoroseus]|nr:hypothetical protein EIP86_009868 [Pleurotus ostreatoroseus]